MDKAGICGHLESSMRANGFKEIKRAMGFGRD
jgi:hypothetical protein